MAFEDMDSTLNAQQYIQQLIAEKVDDVDQILTPPEGQEEGVWKYEHLRQFCMQLNGLAVLLQVLLVHRCVLVLILGRLSTRNVQSNDSYRAMDISLCRAQESKRGMLV